LIYFNQPNGEQGPVLSLKWFKRYFPPVTGETPESAHKKVKIRDGSLFYHYAEWVTNHPRFSVMMTLLILASFINNPWIAGLLFVLFTVELVVRSIVAYHKKKLRPYKGSVNLKVEITFLLLDAIATLSLLITAMQLGYPAEAGVLLRSVRMVYLLRVLRVFRYFDMQSMLSSPTYGMFISLMTLLSFFVEGDFYSCILLFFAAELAVRYSMIRSMRFKTLKEKRKEWAFWSVDMLATLAMIPFFEGSAYAQLLRLLRVIRMARPWVILLRNLKAVFSEGSYMQEINLIVLLLAVLSFFGGVLSHYFLQGYDVTQDGLNTSTDNDILSHVWFVFRMLTDPGNIVYYPDNYELAVLSVVSVVLGVFIFAFFIGIGANLVSALMVKMRNEKLDIANHLVMIGWNDTCPFIIRELQVLSQRKFERLKMVFLLNDEKPPYELMTSKGVMFRWADEIDNSQALDRVSLSSARQVIINVPQERQAYKKMAFSFSTLLAIRDSNPNIYVNYAVPGFMPAFIKSYVHPLQVGWDSDQFYNKPTVMMPEADVIANLVKNVMYYRDFDQVMSSLMVPSKHDESSLNAVAWDGDLLCQDGVYLLKSNLSGMLVALDIVVKSLFLRGVILLALSDDDMNIQSVLGPESEVTVASIIGISLNENRLHGDLEYVMTHANQQSQDMSSVMTELVGLQMSNVLSLLIIGEVGFLPLIMKRLLQNYEELHVVILNDYTDKERDDQQQYIARRLAEEEGAIEKIDFICHAWDFVDMDALRSYLPGVERILISQPSKDEKQSFGVVASQLSHLISLLDEEQMKPHIFPVLKRRDWVLRLQHELDRFNHQHEIHVLVPDEYYGAYVAHTSFHMFTATDESSYMVSRSLRYVIDDLQSEDGKADHFSLDALTVCQELPEKPMALFNALVDRGYLWIGFRCNSSCDWESKEYKLMFTLFPREYHTQCLRQKQIVMNPFGTPVSTQTWHRMREDIAELIVIKHVQEENDCMDDIFF